MAALGGWWRPQQVCAMRKTRKFDEVGEKAELLGEHMADRRWHWGHMTKKIAQMDNGIVVGDQIGCTHAQNIEKSMKIDENWVKNVGNRVGWGSQRSDRRSEL